jgi:hypothetical protein
MIGRRWEICSGKCPPERPCTAAQSEAFRADCDGPKPPIVQNATPGNPANVQQAPAQQAGTQRVSLGCKFLGEKTGGVEECGSCPNGKTKFFVFSCRHPKHKTTTDHFCMQQCPDYEGKE